MNGFHLLFTFYLILNCLKAHKVDKKMIIIRHRDIANVSANSNNYLSDYLPIRSNRHQNETLDRIYSAWSSWTRCESCVQSRTKKCLNPTCYNIRIYEERRCLKNRCLRRALLKSIGDMHIVKRLQGTNVETRTISSKEWGKWSDWSECSRKCRTRRYRTCKKPGRCKKQKQVQSAFCYHPKTQCQNYVLNLIDSKVTEPSHYKYESKKHNSNYYTWKKKCGRPLRKPKMLKIIGGLESKKNKWPWHVAIQNVYKETFCGGTLIAPRWVLTAGHCLRSYLRVRFNEHDLTTTDGREIDIGVTRMFLHPQFDHYTVDNDIALLRLRIPVRQPVACLPSSEPVAKDLCYVMGWGKAKSDDIYGTNTLREARIPVVNETTCRRSYRNYIITKNMFCAGWKSGFADTCAGDSGGGLMCPLKKGSKSTPYAVQGITSFGDGCGKKNKYGIYTKVNNYLKWIDQIIETYS